MHETYDTLRSAFIVNRDLIRNTFPWESLYLPPICAILCVQEGKIVTKEALLAAKELLNSRTGVFSNFRSTAKLAMVTMLALAPRPETLLEGALKVYDALKEHFFTSSFLPVAAMALAQRVDEADYTSLAARTKELYRRMRQEHPFLTSGEDSVFAAMLALSPLPDDAVIAETEACYELLKEALPIGNALQSLSHVLALSEGSPEKKCEKTISLYLRLRDRGLRYGTSYELGTLGIPALLPEREDTLLARIEETHLWLRTQKGYGIFGCTAKQRLMHAALLVSAGYRRDESDPLREASLQSTISMIAAQQAAMCAAIAASAAASSAN